MRPGLAIMEAGYAALGLLMTTAIVAALIVSVSSMKKRDTNFKCGFSTTLLFVALLVENGTWILDLSGGGTPAGISWALGLCGGMHVVAAAFAAWGLREMSVWRKWIYGRQRAIWGLWLNVAMLLVLAAWWYLRSHRELRERILN